MARLFSQLVAVTLLGTVVAAGAGAICAMSAAHAPMAGCHPMQLPAHPHPADSRCCMSPHAVPLLTNAVSPAPALVVLKVDATPDMAATSDGPTLLPSTTPSGGPPGISVLRI